MLGVIVNTATIIAGGAIGLLVKKGIPEKLNKSIMDALALVVIYMGISGALKGDNPSLIFIITSVLTVLIDGSANHFHRNQPELILLFWASHQQDSPFSLPYFHMHYTQSHHYSLALQSAQVSPSSLEGYNTVVLFLNPRIKRVLY